MSKIGVATMMQTFPAALAPKKELAETVALALYSLWLDNGRLEIFSNIDAQPEDVLDILAKDFAVEWYDYNATLETKRAQIKSSVYIHRHRGTKAAIIQAVTDVYPSAHLLEWFEYNGRPGRFKLSINISEGNPEFVPDTILDVMRLYSRLSAIPEKVVLEKDDKNTVYLAAILRRAQSVTISCLVPPIAPVTHLTDDQGRILTDEQDRQLIL